MRFRQMLFGIALSGACGTSSPRGRAKKSSTATRAQPPRAGARKPVPPPSVQPTNSPAHRGCDGRSKKFFRFLFFKKGTKRNQMRFACKTTLGKDSLPQLYKNDKNLAKINKTFIFWNEKSHFSRVKWKALIDSRCDLDYNRPECGRGNTSLTNDF